MRTAWNIPDWHDNTGHHYDDILIPGHETIHQNYRHNITQSSHASLSMERDPGRGGDGHLGESFPIFKSLNAIHIVFYLKTCMKWISLKNKNAQTVIILNQESKCMSLDGCDLMTNYSVQCLISRVLAGIKLPGAPESWLFSWQRHDLWRHWAPRHWGLRRQTHLAATTISKH